MSKRGVQYVEQSDPSFIKKFKQRVGYKEGDNVDTKKVELPIDDSGSDAENEDEKPQIVVLKKGDMNQHEVDEFRNSEKVFDSVDSFGGDAKILFKKPVKHKPDTSGLKITTKKQGQEDNSKTINTSSRSKKSSKISNKSLLSFDDDEDE